jgi:uncharacterized protein with GYD domain
MATFISTVRFTEQGVRAIRDTCDRADKFKVAAKKMGVEVIGTYWTLGTFDGVIILRAPDEATAAAAFMHAGLQGSVRTRTVRAFEADEMRKILAMIPT